MKWNSKVPVINSNSSSLGQPSFVNTEGLDFMLKMSCSDVRYAHIIWYSHKYSTVRTQERFFLKFKFKSCEWISSLFWPWVRVCKNSAQLSQTLMWPLPTKPMEECQASSRLEPEVAPDQHSGWWLSVLLREGSSSLTSGLSENKPSSSQIHVILNVGKQRSGKAVFHIAPREKIKCQKSSLG